MEMEPSLQCTNWQGVFKHASTYVDEYTLCVAFLSPSSNARLAFTSPCTPKSPFLSFSRFQHPCILLLGGKCDGTKVATSFA